MSPERIEIKDTEKSFNIAVAVAGVPSLDEMESILSSAAVDLGMQLSHVTKLGTKRYPGNRHWHLKKDLRTAGCLDVTYWPAGPSMWITIRKSEPEWVHRLGRELGPSLELQMREAS